MSKMKRKKFYWLLRCTDKNSISDLKKGIIRFSCPKRWHNPGCGQNDLYDGAIAVLNKDRDCFVRNKKLCKSIRKDNEFIIYDKRIFNVPCICFYGLESDKNIFRIPKEFFDDFAHSNRNDKSYFIIEANDLFNRLKTAIINFGFEENDLFFHSIKYINIKDVDLYINREKIVFPYELIYKDYKYIKQNESRMFIVSKNQKLITKLLSSENQGRLNFEVDGFKCYEFEIPNPNEEVIIHQDNNGSLEIEYIQSN